MAAGPLMAAWGTEVAIVTYRSFARGGPQTGIGGLPMPSLYLSTILIYGGLGLLAESASFAGVASTVGWGLVLATLLNLWTPGGKVTAAAPAPTTKQGAVA